VICGFVIYDDRPRRDTSTKLAMNRQSGAESPAQVAPRRPDTLRPTSRHGNAGAVGRLHENRSRFAPDCAVLDRHRPTSCQVRGSAVHCEIDGQERQWHEQPLRQDTYPAFTPSIEALNGCILICSAKAP
jgi:hypothetical protein